MLFLITPKKATAIRCNHILHLGFHSHCTVYDDMCIDDPKRSIVGKLKTMLLKVFGVFLCLWAPEHL